MSLKDQLTTINGVVVPTIAYGVYQVKDAAQCQKPLRRISCHHRHSIATIVCQRGE